MGDLRLQQLVRPTPPVCHTRRRLVEDGTPTQPRNGSGVRTPRTGGGARHPTIDAHPDEDEPDEDYNPEAFLDSLKASNQPILKQFAAYLSAKDETITALQQQVKAAQDKAKTQEAIRNYEGTGRSSLLFHPDVIADLMHTFIILHNRDMDDQQFFAFSDLDMATAKPEDLSRGISMCIALSKQVKNGIRAPSACTPPPLKAAPPPGISA